MKNFTRILSLLLALMLVVGLLAACGGEQPGNNDPVNTPDATENGEQPTGSEQSGGDVTAEGPQYGGHLNVRITSAPNGLDPLKQTGAFKYLYMACVFENALCRDADNNIAPGVCDFELSEDLLDLKLWVREGKIFSNGDPVDIYDVEASIIRSMDLYSSSKKYVKPYIDTMTVENDGEKDILHIVFKSYSDKCMYYLASYQTWAAVMPKEICQEYATTYIITDLEDAIGTGPYVFTDIEDSVYVKIEKRADYVPVEGDYTGPAATKYGYLDSMTFWYNTEDATTGMALMNGDYDLAEVLPEEYQEMALANGFVCESLPSNQSCTITLNTRSASSPMAKYPSLRKAVLAAIDYEDFLVTVTDGAHVMEGPDAGFVMNTKYATDAFSSADYFGESKLDLAAEYLDAARAEGYADEPVVVVYNTARSDVPTLITHYLSEAGINYKLETMEQITASAFVGDPSNNWDITFTWSTTTDRPSQLPDSVLDSNYKDDYKDELRKKLDTLDPDSQEYMDVWQELAQYTADGAFFGFMSRIYWFWWHKDTLHTNDEGSQRYMFNTYWDDPANHPAN